MYIVELSRCGIGVALDVSVLRRVGRITDAPTESHGELRIQPRAVHVPTKLALRVIVG